MTVQDRLQRQCSLTECEGKHYSLGYCKIHYQRLSKHGTTDLVDRKPGKRLAFCQNVALSYEGEECLIWPYGRKSDGYASFTYKGKTLVVSRFLCEMVNGAPPTPEHQAAHSCGKGHLGCVTKGHLSWKTRAENMADKLIHGTHSRGERNYSARVTEAQAREIISLIGKEGPSKIARRMGISKRSVSYIQTGGTWAWLREGRS